MRKGRPPRKTWQFFAAARERAGLTQEELAARCGLWQNQIGRWERGESAPSIEYLSRLARVLEVDISTLATEATIFFGPK